MFKWIPVVSLRPAACAFALALIGALAVVATGSDSVAQDKKAPAKKDAPKQQPKQPPQQQAQPEAPQLNFSPWTKFCLKGQEANAKQVCFTGKDGRVETGQPVVAAVLIEPDGEPRKILRITLPLGMSLQPGTRAIIDQGQPMTAPYVICFNNGCMADYEATQALIDTMKKGQGLVIQGINGAGQPISLVLPLSDFAKAYDGPPTDPKELERRNEEERKKFEGQKK
jgi:invasion protein IalB